MTRRQMEKLITALKTMREGAEDELALEAAALYPAWREGETYGQKERIRYGDKLYRCEQTHIAQSDWTPDATPALWTRVSIEEWPDWVQPTGAQDAYSKGDKVSHNGQHWISTADGNVWEPGVWGWEAAARKFMCHTVPTTAF